MRVAYLAAGAGGMYCGSCLHDNRLAATLMAQGRDVRLFPLYTPLRTDEEDVSEARVYYGGINVYLQHACRLFQHTPWFLDRLLDARGLLHWAGRRAASTRPEQLGALTLSVLRGEHGAQRKELEKLVGGLKPGRPGLVYLPNLMFVGMAHRLKESLHAAIACGLVGEDIFLDRLPEPDRGMAFDLIRQRAEAVDGFVALTDYYARHAASHFGLPSERIHRIPMGIRAADFAPGAQGSSEPPTPARGPAAAAGTFTIGYLARICREKGLRMLTEALTRVQRSGRRCRLRVAGYLGGADRAYFDEVRGHVRAAGWSDDFEYVGEVTRTGKIRFLHSLDALAVPTSYPESKGFYVLEALAAGVPTVLPAHGAFPELVGATGGGLLHAPGDPGALAEALARVMDDETLRRQLAERGQQAVRVAFTAERMGIEAWALFQRLANGRPPR